MLRIHFTAQDLVRLRLAADADPLWEAMLSQHVLTSEHGPLTFDRWRQRARSRFTPEMRILLRLAPPRGYTADFITPTSGVHRLDAGLDAIRATPSERIQADLVLMSGQGTLPGWATPLADGDARALRRLTSVMHTYFDAAVAPYWDLIRSEVTAERANRARTMVEYGAESLLTTLHPAVRWESPVLHVVYPDDRDLHLDGRGLVLVPSYFCWPTPIALRAPDLPPVLVYPISHDHDRMAVPASMPSRHLVALLGHTRAAALQAIDAHRYGCTTSELARYVNVSLSSASEHATTLRRAGLLAARPNGKHMLHTVTPLGQALLAGSHDAKSPTRPI